ncbi:MAG TPA: phage/plasmid primase, P4 family [Pirellulales bacterium]|nr:phage/plasmid primase, P4 family [Pirellulales bacterium]
MIEKILARFEGVRSTGQRQWEARCPAHDDRTASLSIGVGDDGRALLHCQASCSTQAVVDAAGLRMRDLFPSNGGKVQKRIVATYDYRDEAGNLLFQVVRYDPKDFRQRSPDGNGGWSWKLNGVRRVLYQLPKLAADPGELIFVVEGEKDADRLQSLGAVATCNVGGAGKWRAEYNEHLRGRHVVILPDSDEPGRRHAQEAAQSLRGVAATVRVLELPGLPAKGDVSDWLNAGGTVEQLRSLALAAEEFEPGHRHDEQDSGARFGHSNEHHSEEAGVPGIGRAEGQTDNANADRVLSRHGDSLLFVERRKCWHVYDGARWAEDHGVAISLAKQNAERLWTEFAATAPGLAGNTLSNALKFVKASNGGSAISNVEKLMRADARVRIPDRDLSSVFDAQAHLLNVLNGTVDLRTGELRPHDRSDRITRLAPVTFDPDAGCPQWREFIRWATVDDRELGQFLQRSLGSALWGEVRDHVLLILYGTGRNGKGTLLSVLRKILGDYATEAAKDLLIERKHEGHATERAALCGRRLVTCTESARRAHLDEALVKQLTGGDTITARGMRENLWSFQPSHTLIMATNHRPRISGTDLGIWSRIRLVPFNARISDAAKDTGLATKLEAEASGILSWLIAGCRLWQDDGFKLMDAAAVTEATAEYRESSDLLKPFLDECTIEQPHGRVLFGDLREAYLSWCKTHGIAQPMGERTFREDLDARGFEGKPGAQGKKFRLGLVLR